MNASIAALLDDPVAVWFRSASPDERFKSAILFAESVAFSLRRDPIALRLGLAVLNVGSAQDDPLRPYFQGAYQLAFAKVFTAGDLTLPPSPALRRMDHPYSAYVALGCPRPSNAYRSLGDRMEALAPPVSEVPASPASGLLDKEEKEESVLSEISERVLHHAEEGKWALIRRSGAFMGWTSRGDLDAVIGRDDDVHPKALARAPLGRTVSRSEDIWASLSYVVPDPEDPQSWIFNTASPALLTPIPGDASDAMALIRHMVSGDEEAAAYVFNWMAVVVQNAVSGNPRSPGTALVFEGPEGSGKSLFVEVQATLLGGKAIRAIVSQAELESDFNGQISGKLLINFDEVMNPETRSQAIANKIKPYITNDEIPLVQKYREARTVRNRASVIFTSNPDAIGRAPVLLGETDRRYSIFATGGAYPSFSGRLWGEVHAGGGPTLRALMFRLMTHKVDRKAAARPFENAMRESVKRLGEPTPVQFMREIIEDGLKTVAMPWLRKQSPERRAEFPIDEGDPVEGDLLFEIYTAWVGKHPVGRKKFTSLAIGDHAPGVEYTRIRVNGERRRVYLGLPLEAPSEGEEDIPAPKTLPTPPPALEEIDDGDFATA